MAEAIKDAVHVISLVGVGHFPLQGFELVVQIADASAACDRFIQNRTALHFLDVLATPINMVWPWRGCMIDSDTGRRSTNFSLP
ncbi:MAG: hypothetical protein WB711_06545 [Terriglobales bacterium]